MAIVDEHSINPPLAFPAEPVSEKDRVGYSPEIEAGKLDMRDVLEPIYKEASEALGRKFEYPEK
jgi:ribonuclease Z